ncbi:hypothetical protein AVEN_262531-1, partial [Araneus ventricosus]
MMLTSLACLRTSALSSPPSPLLSVAFSPCDAMLVAWSPRLFTAGLAVLPAATSSSLY